MKTYVIGHLKPDLDSVVAAISFSELRKLMGGINVTPVATGEANPETKYVFEKFQYPLPDIITSDQIQPNDKIVLVDHNEETQRLTGLNPEQIIAVYDHHKPNFNLPNPIESILRPQGSSNTICWQLLKQGEYSLPSGNYSLPPKIAGLMLCAILSDTVGLKSSTTTQYDRDAVKDLSTISRITDIDTIALEIFKAKSSIASLTDEQVVLNDYKVFDFSGKKVLIGQTETVEQAELLSTRKEGLLNALQSIKVKEGVDHIILAITDILKVNTKLLVAGIEEIELVQKAFGGTVQENILDIGPKMSRKKDIAPAIEMALK